MDTKHKLLFVDDEPYYAQGYMECLKQRFEVVMRNTAHDGVEAGRADDEIRAAVLDYMMPVPSDVDPNCVGGGMSTGRWMLEQLRETIVNRPMPVIILTNRATHDIKQDIASAEIPNGLCVLRFKLETPAFMVPDLLTMLIQKAL